MDLFDVLVGLWFAAAGGGLLSVIAAVASPSRRRFFLQVAAALFVVAGMLGILSIGALFLVAAAVCALASQRARTDEVHL